MRRAPSPSRGRTGVARTAAQAPARARRSEWERTRRSPRPRFRPGPREAATRTDPDCRLIAAAASAARCYRKIGNDDRLTFKSGNRVLDTRIVQQMIDEMRKGHGSPSREDLSDSIDGLRRATPTAKSTMAPPPPDGLLQSYDTPRQGDRNSASRGGSVSMSVTRIGLAVVALVAAVAAVYAIFQALDERSAPPILIEDASANLPVVVEVRGEVEAPGVYALSPGARLQDAIAAAGGLSEEADLSTVNLARRLRDGELIVILALPVPGSTPVPPHRRG